MFVDYITALLVNMVGGLVVLAAFFWRGLGSPGERAWSAALAAVGLVAFALGLHLTVTWPIPNLPAQNLTWANAAYGEMSVLLGVAFLAGALAVGKGWSLVPVTIYASIAGAVAIVLGVRIVHLGLSQLPLMTGIGFFLTGAAGPFALAIALAPKVRALRVLAALDLAAAAALWAVTAVMAYWVHLERLSA